MTDSQLAQELSHHAQFVLYYSSTHTALMAKVVYNACFGGFSLSNEAMDRIVELGYHLEPNPKYNSNTKSKYGDSSQKYECWGYVDCPRHHPILVQVVEELGEKAEYPGVDFRAI